jgi:hypothetical protein
VAPGHAIAGDDHSPEMVIAMSTTGDPVIGRPFSGSPGVRMSCEKMSAEWSSNHQYSPME